MNWLNLKKNKLMKFIPLLFSTPMVQAILKGRKKMTRRIIKPQPDPEGDGIEYIPMAPSLDWEQHYNEIWKGYSMALCKVVDMEYSFVDREDFYCGLSEEDKVRTRKRLTEMNELGMTEVGIAEFGIKDVMSGLYIEKVWAFSDYQFNDYMAWVKEMIEKNKTKKSV